ncbi:MAG: hypothetical protein JSS16_01005 [Proteobacteria bacterium]|nr:hypothetical protein [Pseudomonadota bacterium]
MSTPAPNEASSSPVLAAVRRNAVALISLSVALFSTSYNTWRNQTTEAHRNVREASFVLLEQAGELQQLAQHRYYGGDHSQMNWIACWGKATLIRDMAPLVSKDVQTRAEAVFVAWKENAGELESGRGESAQHIEMAIDALTGEVRDELLALR